MNRVVVGWFVGLVAIAAVVAVGVRAWVGPPDARAVAKAALQSPPGWTPVDWPYLNDQFGRGKAFECTGKDCGAPVRVTFRAKIGFCNCATGVSDDEELERIGDVHLLGGTSAPIDPGREIRVGHMAGRARAYSVEVDGKRRAMLSIAFNDRCDVIVATATSPDAAPARIEPRALEFLESGFVLKWVELTLGL